MKNCLVLLILLSALTGCRNTAHQYDIVKETYIHKYGVPITKSDWDKQGKEGQTIGLRSDGVTITTSYSKGVRHGLTTYTFPNLSTVESVETYDKGELLSRRENYPSGVPMKEEVFEEGTLVKLSTWYEDGTPQASESYLETFMMSGEYRTPLNVVEARVQDGHGIRIWRSNDGDLLSKDTIQNGQMTERVNYFANGDPSTVIPYENGYIHGTKLTFLHGGLPNTVEQWEYGMQNGMTTLFQNGEKISEVPYVQGKKDGIECRYRDGSLLVEEVSWKEDIQHGQRKLFIDGNYKSEWYHDGELVSRTIYERMNLPRKSSS